MSGVSSVAKLAPSVRQMIRARLYECGFTGYKQLADELRAEGINVSKSSLNRFGMKLEAQLNAMEMNDLLQSAKASAQEVANGR